MQAAVIDSSERDVDEGAMVEAVVAGLPWNVERGSLILSHLPLAPRRSMSASMRW